MAIDRETQVLSDAAAAGITRPRELANFMAQVTHESNGLNRLEESFRYTRNISQIPVQSAWREGSQALESARKDALQGKPEQLAELMYGGRNGNDEPGDGWKYHGRGYIQLTGKDNYRAAGEALDLDLVEHPDLAADPANASKIAVWYWENRVPDAARDDVRAATLAVNGKYNGLEDRRQRFDQWEKRLTPEVMERLTHEAPRAMKEGMNGEDVRMLQGNLARLGYNAPNQDTLHTDGKFGPGTIAALEAFQRDHHLAVDGVAGPKTLQAIEQQKVIDAAKETHERWVPARLDHPGHPDHAIYEQARGAVHRLDAQHGRMPDQQSDNLAAALTVAARRDGMTSINHVALSDDATRTYAIQGELNSPLKRVTEVPTAQAVTTPMEQSTAALASTIAAERDKEQRAQQPVPPSPLGPSHGGH